MGVENRILCRHADNAAHQAQSGSRMIRDSAAAHRSQGAIPAAGVQRLPQLHQHGNDLHHHSAELRQNRWLTTSEYMTWRSCGLFKIWLTASANCDIM
jgi:hypothetical protein